MGTKVCVIPKNNASDDNVRVTRIYFENGSFVHKGDLLFEFETSKATFDVFSEISGFALFHVKEGRSYPTGFQAVIFFTTMDGYNSVVPVINESLNLSELAGGDVVFSRKAIKYIEENKIDITIFKDFNPENGVISERDVINYHRPSTNSYKLGSQRFSDTDIIIFGAGGHALQCLDIIEESNYNFKGFVAESYEEKFAHLAIGSTLNDILLMNKEGLKNVAIGFGLLENLELRFNFYEQLLAAGLRIPSLISKSACISPRCEIDKNYGIQVFQGAVIGPDVLLEENVVVNSNATVSHHCHLHRGAFVAPGAILAGNVEVGEYSLIGMGVTIFMKVKISSRSIIKNGANVF